MSCDSGQTKSTTFYPKPEATSSAPIRASNFLSFMDWKPFDAITASFMAFFVFKIFSLRECGFEPQLNTVLKRNHFMVPTIQSNSIQWCPVQTTLQYCSAVCRHEFPTSSYRSHFFGVPCRHVVRNFPLFRPFGLPRTFAETGNRRPALEIAPRNNLTAFKFGFVLGGTRIGDGSTPSFLEGTFHLLCVGSIKTVLK